MAVNQLLPFATAEGANVIPYTEWQALTTILNNGFQSGIASSQQINRILAQGGVAGYVMGEIVKQYQNVDATLDPTSLYTNFVAALVSIISANSVNAAALKAAFPVGSYLFYAGKVCPSGFLPCNGGAISRTTYAELFTAIGTKYGAGDGSTTFNLPDLNGRVLQGVSDTSQVGTYLEASLPNITGNLSGVYLLTENSPTGSFQASAPTGLTGYPETPYGAGWGMIGYHAQLSSGVYGESETVQPAACLSLVAIRY